MPCITLSSGKSVCFKGNKYPDGGQTVKKGPGPFLIPESRPQFKSIPVANLSDPRLRAYQDSSRINQNSIRELEAFNKAVNNKQPYTTSAQTYDDNYNTTAGSSKSTYTNPRNTKNYLNPSKSIQGLTEQQRQNFHKGFDTAENGTPENLPTALYSAEVTNPAMYKDEQLWLPYHTNPVQPYHLEPIEQIASKSVPRIPVNDERVLPSMNFQIPTFSGTPREVKTEGLTVPVPTIDIVKETVPPRVNAKRKQNKVNVGSGTKTKVKFGIDQREIMSRGDLDSLRESVGLEPKGYDKGGKTTPAQADALNDAKTFQEQWMESPMYNQMITNSVAKDNPYGLDSSYVDYITMKRKQGLDATTASATDWSGDHRNVVPGKSDYYYKNQLRGVNYKDTDKQRLDSFPSPLGYIFNDPNTAYRNEGYNFVPELGYFNTLVNHNLHNHHFRDTSGHEISHATDWNGWFIPESDKIKMAKYKNVYAKNPAEGDYIGTPTETRARLNSIRQLSKDAGYYDPFTQKATMNVLDKFKTLDNNQYKQLKQIYTDAEILDMLNTISMSDNNQYQNYG